MCNIYVFNQIYSYKNAYHETKYSTQKFEEKLTHKNIKLIIFSRIIVKITKRL